MPRRRTPDDHDPNVTAFNVIRQATGGDEDAEETPEPTPAPPPEKNPAAVALGRLGGKKGGKARAESLTPEQRKEIARTAAKRRWGKKAEGDSGGES